MNDWIAGNLIWPATERILGRDTVHRFRRLMRSDGYSRQELAALQAAKLRRLLALAGEHCPFYRERFGKVGIDVRDPNLGLAVLTVLPVLDRGDVQTHVEEMSWQDCPGGPARPYNTGGSTGAPLKFYIDRCRQSADWASRWRHRSWWGLRPGSREVMLWAGPMAGRSAAGRMGWANRLRIARDGLLNQHVLDAFNMTDQTMDAYAHHIAELRPRLLYGYASSLALLARHLLARGRILDVHQSPRAVFATGETVAAPDAADIRAAFGAPVVIEYGSRDCGYLAGGCEAGRLHVAEENVIVEVLDDKGRPAAPGEVGEIVVTCLESFATPLIRYRIGDLGLVPADADRRDGRCACGRASRQLMEIRGRVTDQIVCRQDGHIRRMHALSLMYVLREAEGLRQFRIVQRSLDTLVVEVVTDERFTPGVEESVREGLQRRMGREVAIRINRRRCIPPGSSGKHACVVSDVRCDEDK